MMKSPVTSIAVRVLVTMAAVLSAAEARAQTDNRLAVGLSITTGAATYAGIGQTHQVSIEARIGHDEQPWGWQISLFNWVHTDVQQSLGFGIHNPGQLRLRPMLAGYGYTWIRGRTALTADLLGGFAWNAFRLDPDVAAALQRMGAADLRVDVTNTFALKPEVLLWYDLNSRFGLKVSGGYLITRPTVTLTSTTGTVKSSLKADSTLVTIGLVYSIR